MGAKDRWDIEFKCPECGKIGKADLSQEDGWAFMRDQSTSVDSVSDGFSYRLVDNRPKFFCSIDSVDVVSVAG